MISWQNVTAQVNTQTTQNERPRREATERQHHDGWPGRPQGMRRPGGPGSRQTDIKYSGAVTITAGAAETGKTYQSDKTDESALLISTGEAVTISQPTITKTGSSDGGDNCSFYGVNAALLVKGGGTATIHGGTITRMARAPTAFSHMAAMAAVMEDRATAPPSSSRAHRSPPPPTAPGAS